jgi:nitroreductase
MDFEEVVQTRRSVHEYSDEPISEDTFERIFKLATLAPSGYNLQPWEFLALRDDEQKAALREVANDQEHVTEADTTVVVLGNTNPMAHAESVFDDWLDKGYLPSDDVREAVLGNVEAMAEMPEDERRAWSTRSTALAAMSVMYAAWNEGVASCPMEGFDAEALIETFDIPDGYEPVMLITLGYPAEEAADIENERKQRRPVEEVLHVDEFAPVEETVVADD